MASPLLPHRIPRAVRVGEKVAFSRTLTEADAALFIGVTWDVNPYHTDDAYVAQTRFGRRIVPGLSMSQANQLDQPAWLTAPVHKEADRSLQKADWIPVLDYRDQGPDRRLYRREN